MVGLNFCRTEILIVHDQEARSVSHAVCQLADGRASAGTLRNRYGGTDLACTEFRSLLVAGLAYDQSTPEAVKLREH